MNTIRHDPVLGEGTAALAQYGALCWRLHRGTVQFLLVTSRETRRWIIPKGWPMVGRTPFEAAKTEAWEEAGVRGNVETGILGVFVYAKVMTPTLFIPCEVAVYSLRVTGLERRYPERKDRRRKWFPTEKAMRRVAEPDLQALMLNFSEGRARAGLFTVKTTRAGK